MNFENGHIYHIFNQGNDRQQIFIKPENYLFFVTKIKTHITPFADILAWCLMPNHFHLMVLFNNSVGATLSRTPTLIAEGFNKSIGVMLASYTRAINKQENRTGSLFRDKTKAECLTNMQGVTPSFYDTKQGSLINIPNLEKEYPQVCFNYIHNNPVKAGLVKQPVDWEFSSFRDYLGQRNGQLVNKLLAKEYGLI